MNSGRSLIRFMCFLSLLHHENMVVHRTLVSGKKIFILMMPAEIDMFCSKNRIDQTRVYFSRNLLKEHKNIFRQASSYCGRWKLSWH